MSPERALPPPHTITFLRGPNCCHERFCTAVPGLHSFSMDGMVLCLAGAAKARFNFVGRGSGGRVGLHAAARLKTVAWPFLIPAMFPLARAIQRLNCS